jgi:hypothetical protein
MKPAAILSALLASTALAIPTAKREESKANLDVHGLGDQGDGYYQVVINDKGQSEVKFTPIPHLNLNSTAPETEVTKRDLKLGKRAETVCDGRLANPVDISWAVSRLAENADWMGDNGNWHNAGHWGW